MMELWNEKQGLGSGKERSGVIGLPSTLPSGSLLFLSPIISQSDLAVLQYLMVRP